MKTSEFDKKRKIILHPADGGEAIEYDSYQEMILDHTDEVNKEIWARVHEKVVFVAHRFDRIGKITERFETEEEAIIYACALNKYFAMAEEHSIWEDE